MGVDPGRVETRADLVRELEVLRGNAARGSGRARVSLAELTKRVGVPRSTVHTYLTGQTLVPAEVLDRIVIALGASAADQGRWADAWDRVAAHEHRAKQVPELVVPRQLPPDVSEFTGRADELLQLDRLAEQGVMIVAGTPGVGKTALAVRWAHRNAHRFPDGQLYLNLRGYDARTPVAPSDAAAALLRALNCDEVPRTLEERTALLRTSLAGRQMLVVLDNAGSEEQVRPLLTGTSTVVTSRDALSGLVITEGAQRLDLDVLTVDEAHEMLRALLGERVGYEREAARRLSELCARLPLALRIVAEFARQEPLQEVARHLEAERLDLLDTSGDPRSMVRAVFSWSYRQLDPEVAQLFRLLATHPGRDADVPAVAALAGTDLAGAARRIEHLVRANLVQRGSGRYEMHDLLRDYSRELALDVEAEPAKVRLIDHYVEAQTAAFALVYPNHHAGEGTEVGWLPDADTARAWLSAEADNVVEVVRLAAEAGLGTTARQLAGVARRYLDTTSHSGQAMRMHRIALDTARADEDLRGEATALRNLGIAADAMGAQLESLDWLRQSAGIWQALGDRERWAATLSSIGITLGALGRIDESVAAQEQSIELSREFDQPHGFAIGLLNLGVALEQKGELRRSLQNHREALKIFETLGDQLGQAHALANVGNVLVQLNEHDEARPVLDRALTAYREQGSRIGEAYVAKFLGQVHEAERDYEQAIAKYAESLELTREAGDLALQAEVLNALGAASCRTGEHTAARHAHHDALALAIEHGYQVHEAKALEGLGEIAWATGAAESAKRHWRKAIDRFEALGLPDAERLSRLVQLRPEPGPERASRC